MSDPKILQEEIFKIIDNLYQSKLVIETIKVETDAFFSIDDKKYSVIYSDPQIKFEFITSERYGIWGITQMIKLDYILQKLQEEIRNSKLEHLLS